MLRRAAAAAREMRRRRFLPAPSPAVTTSRRYLGSPRPRDYGAPAGVVREDNVADIRPPTSSAADIRVSNSIPAPNLHFLHGVPRLSLSVRLDRITPGVLRRLGALPIHSKLLSKILKPHLSSYKKELRKIVDEELKPYRDNVSIIDRAIRWVRFISDLAIITVSTCVVAIVFYSQMYPLKWRARVDGLIDDLAQSLKYKTFGGWLGGETLVARYLKIKAEEEEKIKKVEEEIKKKAEEEEKMRAEGRHRPATRRLTVADLKLAGYIIARDPHKLSPPKDARDSAHVGHWDRSNKLLMTSLTNRVFWGGRRF